MSGTPKTSNNLDFFFHFSKKEGKRKKKKFQTDFLFLQNAIQQSKSRKLRFWTHFLTFYAAYIQFGGILDA